VLVPVSGYLMDLTMDPLMEFEMDLLMEQEMVARMALVSVPVMVPGMEQRMAVPQNNRLLHK
jgi:hypothetical protein